MPSATIVEKKHLAVAVLAAVLAWGVCSTPTPARASESSGAVSVGAASAPAEGETEATEAEGSAKPSEAASEAEEAELNGVSLATWYGPGLFGRHTACGQLLTKRTVGVANKTLPCGTLVEMRYRGHHLTVPVIDRGPYDGADGASWDLTEDAAHLLHMTESERVTAKIVGHVKNTAELGIDQSASSSRVKASKGSGATGGTSG